MLSGSIRWFSSVRGYGFIIPSDNTNDVFLHARIVRASGIDPITLKDGAKIQYEPGIGRKGMQAICIALAE